jgi:hypothetical protein
MQVEEIIAWIETFFESMVSKVYKIHSLPSEQFKSHIILEKIRVEKYNTHYIY